MAGLGITPEKPLITFAFFVFLAILNGTIDNPTRFMYNVGKSVKRSVMRGLVANGNS